MNFTIIDNGIALINLTPHEVRDVQSGVTVPPSGSILRVSHTRKEEFSVGGVSFNSTAYGPVELTTSLGGVFRGVEEVEDALEMGDYDKTTFYFVVSALAKVAYREQAGDGACLNLISPGAPVRDAEGRIIGCQGFDL